MTRVRVPGAARDFSSPSQSTSSADSLTPSVRTAASVQCNRMHQQQSLHTLRILAEHWAAIPLFEHAEILHTY